MKNIFAKASLKDLLKDPKQINKLLYRVMPQLVFEISKKYFRLTVEGTEYLPRKGRGIITPNHSGFSGFDAILLGGEVYEAIERTPKILAHHLWFFTKAIAYPAQKLGMIEATTKNGLAELKKNNLIILFPEGERGNFKPTTKRYKLQEFKRGFVRMALLTQSPIIPTLIIGAEETHINLKQLDFSKFLVGTVLPLPLNIVPLPAKWKIKFLPPIELPFKADKVNDSELVHEIANDIQEKIQIELTKEINKRNSIFI